MVRSRLSKVAVLDDDQDAASSVADLLSTQGLSAYAFTTAGSLVSAAKVESFSAFVVDWLLGDSNATGLIEELRGNPALADVPFFLLSGNLAVSGVPSDLELAQVIRLHNLHYRVKPYSLIALARELLEALDNAPI
jgi:DNA-binding response OmpR family regulator